MLLCSQNLCFTKKIRYVSRKQLAEQRPRVKGQFVRQLTSKLHPEDDHEDGTPTDMLPEPSPMEEDEEMYVQDHTVEGDEQDEDDEEDLEENTREDDEPMVRACMYI